MAPRASIRIRWWMIAVATIVVLGLGTLAVGVIQRADGKRRYQAQVAAEQVQGRVATVADFVNQTPPVDRTLQHAWAAWSTAHVSGLTDPQYDRAAWNHWLAAGGEPPGLIAATIKQRRADLDPALALLRRGGLLLSARGWAAAELPPGRRTLHDVAKVTLPNLLAVRDLASWLGYAAVLAEDPAVHLADLDALRTAMDQPGTLIDAMIALALADIRNRAYVDLALRGGLSNQRAVAWLSESPRSLELVAEGIDGERALFIDGTAAWVGESTPFDLDRSGTLNHSGPSGWLSHLDIWVRGLDDCARMAEHNLHLADRLRGLRPDAPSSIQAKLGALGRLGMASLSQCSLTAHEADAGERMARLALRVLMLARQSGLPPDHTALETAVGTVECRPVGDRLRLRYEPLGTDRFRITIDPASPLLDFDDPTRMKARSSAAGTPRAREILVWERSRIIELPIPAP